LTLVSIAKISGLITILAIISIGPHCNVIACIVIDPVTKVVSLGGERLQGSYNYFSVHDGLAETAAANTQQPTRNTQFSTNGSGNGWRQRPSAFRRCRCRLLGNWEFLVGC
jgi:hypothetical protein